MKKLALLLLPALILLFGCQLKQDPAKTEASKVDEEKSETIIVKDEEPIAEPGIRDINPPSADQKNTSTLFRRGLELVKSQKYEEGIAYFNRALESDPQNARIIFNRGNAYFIMKDY